MAASARNPVLPQATPVEALSAHLRRPGMDAKRWILIARGWAMKHFCPETDSSDIELANRPGAESRELADDFNADFERC